MGAPFHARAAKVRSALLCCIALAALAGSAHAALIQDILGHPSLYDGRTVVVEGRVEAAISLLLVKAFRLNDGSGRIDVISTGPLPRRGDWVRVGGRVHELFSFGPERMVVMVEGNRPPTDIYTGDPPRAPPGQFALPESCLYALPRDANRGEKWTSIPLAPSRRLSRPWRAGPTAGRTSRGAWS